MDGKGLMKSFCVGALIGLLLSLFCSRGEGLLRLCGNALFLGGIMLLIYALFEWTLNLGFYNGMIYAFKKIKEAFANKDYDPKLSKLKSRPEYEKTHTGGKMCKEQFAVAFLMILLSAFVAFFD